MTVLKRLPLALILFGTLALSIPAASQAWNNGLARTPPMGFNTWDALGCSNYTAADVKQIADRMVSSGLAAAGYRLLVLDDCWMGSSRTASGNLVAPADRFPDGMKALVQYVHSKGLLFGLYEDAGTYTCQGRPGSYGHEAQDARLFASWGVDYVKYDWCYVDWGPNPALATDQSLSADLAGASSYHLASTLYARMQQSIERAGRPMIFEMCTGWDSSILPPPPRWAPALANVWRTTGDIHDSWRGVLRNFKQNAPFARFASPGAFNDPDLLEVGNGGMTRVEYRSQISLWAIMAAPLIVSSDIRSDRPQALSLLLNRAVIAVDQDRLGRQGVVLKHARAHWILAKRLAGGQVAIAMFNAGGVPARMRIALRRAGLSPRRRYLVRNLWTGQQRTVSGSYRATVYPHGTLLVRLTAP